MIFISSPRRWAPVLSFVLLIMLCFLPGCSLPTQTPGGHSHSHDSAADDHSHEDEHMHGEDNETVTVWTDELELFTEFPLLVTGEPQSFLLHLTYVKTGLAVRDVPVGYRAEPKGGGAALEGRAEALRPGIYTIAPVFPSSGEWKIDLLVPLEADMVTISMDDLDVHGEDEMHDHDHHDDEPSNVIPFTKEQQWVIPVVTVEARIGELVERHKLAGRIPITPESRSTVTAPLGGLVSPVGSGVFPGVGDMVTAGQVLAHVTPTDLGAESLAREANVQDLTSLRVDLAARATQAAGEAAGAKALVAQHEIALERAENLLAAKAGSQREVDALRGVLAEARASLSAAEQVASQARRALEELSTKSGHRLAAETPVTTPISGRVTRISSGPGARVEGGEPIFEIINTDRVLIEGRVPESLAARLAQPPAGLFEVPGHPDELHAIVTPEGAPEPWMLPYVDEETRTIPILFHATNPEGLLRVGMTLTLWADGRQVAEALHIPVSAVVDEHGVPTVYVMLEGETFQKRNVRLGVTDGTWIEVLDGVHPGERVVSQGAYVVRLAGLAGAELGSAHVH